MTAARKVTSAAAHRSPQRDGELLLFLDLTSRSWSKAEICAAFGKLARRLGFRDFVCLRLLSPDRIEASSLLARSRGRACRSGDLASGAHRSKPVMKEQSNRRSHASSDVLRDRILARDGRRCMEINCRHGLTEAFVVAVDDPSGEATGVVGIGAANVELNAVTRATLTCAAEQFYRSIIRIAGAKPDGATAPTPRELEILTWIACGKSDWQIGRILGISAKTVNYHAENVKRKFGVATRIQAVARALQKGAIIV